MSEDHSLRLACLQEAFGFLIEDFGYRCVRADPKVVRYESNRAFVHIDHADLEGARLGLTFGALGSQGEIVATFDAQDLRALATVTGSQGFLERPVRDWRDLEEALLDCQRFLLKHGLGILRGDRRLLDQLALARQGRTRQAGRIISQQLASRAGAGAQVSLTPSRPRQVASPLWPLMDPRAMVLLEGAKANAQEILRVFLDPRRRPDWPRQVQSLCPRSGDFAQVFAPTSAAQAQGLYQTIWQREVSVPAPRPDQTELAITTCFAEWLGSRHLLSEAFPDGYRAIADQLAPGFIWAVWRYTAPDGSRALAFDGLVAIDERWVWLPRPHRLLTGG